MANEEEPDMKALVASSTAVIISEDGVNGNLVTFMVDNGASGHYFVDAIIRDLKNRQHDYVHLSTPRKILATRGALLNGTIEGVLQGLITDGNGNQVLVRVDIVVVPGIRRDLISVMTVA